MRVIKSEKETIWERKKERVRTRDKRGRDQRKKARGCLNGRK